MFFNGFAENWTEDTREVVAEKGYYYGPENLKNLKTPEKSRKLNRFFHNVFRTPSTAATEPEPSHRLLWVYAWPTLLPHVVKPACKKTDSDGFRETPVPDCIQMSRVAISCLRVVVAMFRDGPPRDAGQELTHLN